MKATGMVRKVDELGRVVLPKELRNTMKIEEKTPLEIFVDDNTIVLKKYEPGCTFCGNSEEDMFIFGGKHFCKSCANKIREIIKEQKENR